MFLLPVCLALASRAQLFGVPSCPQTLWVSISISSDRVASLSTQAFPLEDMEHVSNKDDMKTSLRKVVREVRSGYCPFMSDWGHPWGCGSDYLERNWGEKFVVRNLWICLSVSGLSVSIH